MKHYPTPSNFIYPEIKPEDYRLGTLGGKELRENGDWRDYLPPEEHQNIRGIESSACYIEAQQHAIATIEEETYNEIDNNYSARFNALLSDGSIFGGNPLKGGESIRKDGLIPDSLMPFGEYVSSWEDFHSWKGVDEKECRAKGEEYLKGKVLNYEVVFEKHEPLATKYQKLRQSLKYSPVPISVSAWYEENGQYIKPDGVIDNHFVLAVFVDEKNRIHVRDTYAPFNKILAPNYNCDFAMRWTVRKKDPELEKQTFFALLANGLVKFFADWWKAFYNPPIPEPPELPIKEIIQNKDYLTPMAEAIQLFEGWAEPNGKDRTGKVWPNGSLSWRNNNPGNIKNSDGNFIKYSTYEVGFSALVYYLTRACTGRHKSYKPTMSIREFFGVYSPDGNEIESNYASFVCKYMSEKLKEPIYPSKQLKDLV